MEKCMMLLFFICLGMVGKSQGLTGTVTDVDNNPIPNATVIVYDSIFNDMCATDILGKFHITDSPNTISVKISCVGFETFVKEIALNKLPDNHLPVILNISITNLKETTVKAKIPVMKKELGKFVMTNIAQSIYAKGNDAYTFLKYVPVLNVTSEGINILNRGDYAKIYINGRPANISLHSIPAKNVERIEIMAIPGAAYSASNKQGIMNVVLKRQIDEGVKTTVRLTDVQDYYNSQDANVFVNYANKKLNLTGSVSGKNSKSYFTSQTTYNYLTDNLTNSVDINSIRDNFNLGGGLNLEYSFTEKQVLGLRISASGSESTKKYNSNTIYKKISETLYDSIYIGTIENKTPDFIPAYGINLSYDLKTDDQGSLLKADLSYGANKGKNEIKGLDGLLTNSVETIRQDYLQTTHAEGNYLAWTTDFSKKFDEDNTLSTGVAFNYAKTDNQLIYANDTGAGYISDLSKTNSFLFKDITGAFYISYDKTWSDKFETSVGVRAEYYWAEGLQKMTNETIDRKEFDIFPTISLLYTPHDDHEFSLDLSSSILRPPYSMLNPFKYYTSSTTYQQNNPDLKSSIDYEAMFSYMILEDYIFNIDYAYSKDCWTEFSIPDEEGKIRSISANYGDSHYLSFSWIIQKTMFNGFWNMNANIDCSYTKDNGAYADFKVDNEHWSYFFKINNGVFLAKNRSWQTFITYQISSRRRWVTLRLPLTQGLNFSLQKIFRNSSLSLSVSNLVNNKLKLSSNLLSGNYNYTMTNKAYPKFSLSYSHTFGNKKVKNVQNRYNSNLQERTQ